MKFTTKQLTRTAILLAICLISQYFKNLSVYLTGPVINTVLIIATLTAGLASGILISLIAPITAFFLTGSPIMSAIPLMFPVIMLGNIIIVIFTWYFQNRLHFSWHLPAGLILGSIAKSVFLGILVSVVLLPLYGSSIASHLPKPEALPAVLAAAKITFSYTQLVTALLGSLLAWLIWIPLQKYLRADQD